jgi:hypothetical protein
MLFFKRLQQKCVMCRAQHIRDNILPELDQGYLVKTGFCTVYSRGLIAEIDLTLVGVAWAKQQGRPTYEDKGRLR